MLFQQRLGVAASLAVRPVVVGHPPLGQSPPSQLRRLEAAFATEFRSARYSPDIRTFFCRNEYSIPQWVYQDE